MRVKLFISWAVLCLLALFATGACLQAREAGWVPAPQEKVKRDIGRKPAQATTSTPRKAPAKSANVQKKRAARSPDATVYDNQPAVTERELNDFVILLPQFRAWARKNREEAHPVLNAMGKPDFKYSGQAAKWVREHDFEPERFFCVMGKMAAGMVIVEEGNDLKGTRPSDMPEVTASELELVRRHLGELLAAGGSPPPMR